MIVIHELVAKEYDEAIEWHERQQAGLGERFKSEVFRFCQNCGKSIIVYQIITRHPSMSFGKISLHDRLSSR
jgi:hypothetical protein